MVGLSQAMLDVVGSADLVEVVDPILSGPAMAIARQVGANSATLIHRGCTTFRFSHYEPELNAATRAPAMFVRASERRSEISHAIDNNEHS